jgi:hypothetical protein
MIDWNLVANVAGGGFGITILVLVVLSLIAWLVGLIMKKTKAKPEETAAKDK